MILKKQNGFTLIELLVVIAIIGLLSSIILASLNSTRNKGKASAIKHELQSLRTQVELLANGSNYGAINVNGGGSVAACATGLLNDPLATPIKTGIAANNPTVALTCSSDVTTGNASKWSASVILPDTSGSFCIDSSGFAKSIAGKVAIDATVQNNGVCI